MISCGDDRGDNELWGAGFDAGAEGVETEPEAVRPAGGGLDAATGVLLFAAAEAETGFFAILGTWCGSDRRGVVMVKHQDFFVAWRVSLMSMHTTMRISLSAVAMKQRVAKLEPRGICRRAAT